MENIPQAMEELIQTPMNLVGGLSMAALPRMQTAPRRRLLTVLVIAVEQILRRLLLTNVAAIQILTKHVDIMIKTNHAEMVIKMKHVEKLAFSLVMLQRIMIIIAIWALLILIIQMTLIKEIKMIKNYACLKLLFWVLIANIIFSMNSSIQAEDISDAQKLFSDIKLELAKYKKLEGKYPNLHVYRLKGNNYGEFANYFRVNKEYTTYLHSLNQVQQRDFLEYDKLLQRRSIKDFYSKNSFKEITELLKENFPQNKELLTFLKYFDLEKMQLTSLEEQRLDSLENK
ncbi:MAG: hypothetical protein A2020_02415 [Lentisphaerae bacterium GWF2_45_14]|nr:MAG: hypothetical protein A2020_02415 [Lentisphaerae bacterium GWF2_45_14]